MTGLRAGAHALSLLSVPLNVQILRTLDDEPTALTDLRRAVGSPPQTTMRGHLRFLTEQGILERRRQNDFPGLVDFALRCPGEELLAVADVVQRWLYEAPNGSLPLGAAAAKSTIKALVDGWVTNVVRALCAKRLSLTELNALISSVSYPSLKRHVTAMRLAGQIEGCHGAGRSTPYTVTGWLRRSVAPLVAAMRWEQVHAQQRAAPLGRLDAESIFLLAIPLLRLGSDADGACRLMFETGTGDNHRLSGVTAVFKEGRPASCLARLDAGTDASATGLPVAWFDAILKGAGDRLEFGGDCGFARDVVEGLHSILRPRAFAPAG